VHHYESLSLNQLGVTIIPIAIENKNQTQGPSDGY